MTWWKKLKLWWFTKRTKRHYAKYDPDVCCCGDNMDTVYPGITCPGACRSQVEYSTTKAIEWYRKHIGL